MSAQTIQHTAPIRVYRQKYWKLTLVMGGLAVAGLLVILATKRFGDIAITPSFSWSPLVSCIVMLIIVSLTLRNPMVISPAGISYRLSTNRVAVTWSNVERLELINPEKWFNFALAPCLTLREPVQARGFMWGIPVELRGRVLPLYLSMWERSVDLEQAIYHYAPQVLSHADGQRYPPFDLSRVVAEQKRRGWITTFVMIGVVVALMIMSL